MRKPYHDEQHADLIEADMHIHIKMSLIDNLDNTRNCNNLYLLTRRATGFLILGVKVWNAIDSINKRTNSIYSFIRHNKRFFCCVIIIKQIKSYYHYHVDASIFLMLLYSSLLSLSSLRFLSLLLPAFLCFFFSTMLFFSFD